MTDISSKSARRASHTLFACLASCALTLAILFAVYALRGVWPFGADNVAFMDTTQFFTPDYYALWDAMHGARAVGLNWFAGLAESGTTGWSSLLVNNISWVCFLNPANWVFLLVARDHILEGLSLYLAAYVAMTAVSACLMLRLRFPRMRPIWAVLFSLVYALSGYTLQYYFSFGWFLVLILFPVLLFGLERLLREGKYVVYTAAYAILLSLSVYFGFMATVYILLFSLGYVIFLLPKDQRGDRIVRLGLSTVAALGIGAFFWTAGLSAFAGTSRFDSNLSSGLINGFSTWNIPYTASTVVMLLGTALPVSLLIRRSPHFTDKRIARFFLLLLGALLIPMIFTNIDTAWHFGQYNMFPMRYGFMLPATLICAAACCLDRENCDNEETEGTGRAWPFAVGAIAAAAALALLDPKLAAWFHEYTTNYLTTVGARVYWLKYFPLLAGCGVLFVLLYLCLFRLRSRRLSLCLVTAALVLQLGVNAWGLVAPNDDHSYMREFDPAYIEMADDVYAYFADKDIPPLSRVKNPDCSMNVGYPTLAGVAALSSVNSLNSSERLAAFEALGYSTHYFRIIDTGGTVFSDMLLGVDRVLTLEPADSSLYTDTGETAGTLHIADADYPGLVGLTFPDGALDGCLELPAMADRLNALYSAFTGSDEELASSPAYSVTYEGEGFRTYTITCELAEESFLYLSSDSLLTAITASGRSISVPSYRNPDNLAYPFVFNSNLLFLGRFGAGQVELQCRTAIDIDEESLSLTALHAAALDSFRADARYDPETLIKAADDSLSVTLRADEGMSLFLPMTYSDRWQCTVNGEPVQPDIALGTLMSIPLEAGENRVELTYRPAWHRVGPGLFLSAASIILAAAWLILRRRPPLRGLRLPDGAYTAACWLFYAVCAAMILFIYLVPTALLILRGSIIRI